MLQGSSLWIQIPLAQEQQWKMEVLEKQQSTHRELTFILGTILEHMHLELLSSLFCLPFSDCHWPYSDWDSHAAMASLGLSCGSNDSCVLATRFPEFAGSCCPGQFLSFSVALVDWLWNGPESGLWAPVVPKKFQGLVNVRVAPTNHSLQLFRIFG